MVDIKVSQLAKLIKIDPQILLKKIKQAGVEKKSIDDLITDVEKNKLLAFLKNASTTNKTVLLKKKTTIIKKSNSATNKNVNVEVKRKKTIIPPASTVKKIIQIHENSSPEIEQDIKSKLKDVKQDEKLESSKSTPDEVLKSEKNITNEGVSDTKSRKDDTESQTKTSNKKNLRHGSLKHNKIKEDKSEEKTASKKVQKKMRQNDKVRANLYKLGDDFDEVDFMHSKVKKNRNSKSAFNHQFVKPVEKKIKEVTIFDGITVGELAQRLAVKSSDLTNILVNMDMKVTTNQPLDQDIAVLLVEELGHKYNIHRLDKIEETIFIDDTNYKKKTRPPVVTIMGHVDHGKTSLLDFIRKTKVASIEAGGITQHIGAYSVNINDNKSITFLDTPGHEAFTSMRIRGANSTDIVILVVAADDGVMPQTIEAIQHSKAANVPIIVAVNKIDKPEADLEKIKTNLSQHDVIAEDWGGEVMFVSVSAKTGEGIDKLLESISLQAELLELKSICEGYAKGIVIESKVEKGRGIVATILVTSGILKKGDIVLCGTGYGKIRVMSNDLGKSINRAYVSMPVEVTGLSSIPKAGDDMVVVKDDKVARTVSNFRIQREKNETQKKQQAIKLSNLFDTFSDNDGKAVQEKFVNIILKADVQGSLEAIQDALLKLSNEQVKINIIAGSIGGINSSDINLSLASQASIFGFNVRADSPARKKAENESVEIRYYSIIYDVIDDVKKAINGMLTSDSKETIIGIAEVRDVFKSSKFGSIAGCIVSEGVIKRNNPIRVLREQIVIYEGTLESLKRFKENVNDVKKGLECGIGVKNYNDIKSGDQIEVFENSVNTVKEKRNT